MEVYLEKQAKKYLSKMEDVQQQRFENAFLGLRNLDGDIKKLAGRVNEYRLRVGDYRAIFTVEGETIIIKKIASRGDVYK